MRSITKIRRVAVLIIAVAVPALAAPAIGVADLQGRIGSLSSGVQSDSSQIDQFRGRLADLRQRLGALETSAATEQGLLDQVRAALRQERGRALALQLQYGEGRQTLAQQLVAQYESPPPDAMEVIISSRGFTDLLETLNDMKLVAQGNAQAIQKIAGERTAAQQEAAKLATDEQRQSRVTAAVLAERDQIVALKLSLLRGESAAAQDRARKNHQLGTLERQLAIEQRQAAAAQGISFGLLAPPGAGYNGSGFTPHGGSSGFFPAAGTNYSVNEEPQIAARLDQLGRALGIHLIGISGYRTPQHSMEVGGFADDPHTKGEASDTPGIEGVSEGTLEQFGLTRPFSAASEADHIQLLSWTISQCGRPTCN
jgi:peptidoglycan hydrolase CwlO-like protein